ncbi:MAG: DUF4198 domain-containing protein [Chitinophagaceae bacterium]|nr:MAG: DUF4198 domain-containing protein [Chitinophagaceae bacterium]
MKKILFLSACTVLTLALAAHEFWLAPGKFIYKKGDVLTLRFEVGEDFTGEGWTGNRDKVVSLLHHAPSGTFSIADKMPAVKGDSMRLTLEEEGTQMISFNSNNSFISLPAKEFEAYLREDQLADALEFRKRNRESDSTGREYYQRSVKTIFQVGGLFTPGICSKTSLPLDLVPLQNPYQLQEDDSLTVRVLFKGEPLKNQYTVVWHRNREIFLKVPYRTNDKGEIRFPVIPRSKWMVSTVKMERLEKGGPADWQSYWGSLTWGYN